jgi:hypothetical protein
MCMCPQRERNTTPLVVPARARRTVAPCAPCPRRPPSPARSASSRAAPETAGDCGDRGDHRSARRKARRSVRSARARESCRGAPARSTSGRGHPAVRAAELLRETAGHELVLHAPRRADRREPDHRPCPPVTAPAPAGSRVALIVSIVSMNPRSWVAPAGARDQEQGVDIALAANGRVEAEGRAGGENRAFCAARESAHHSHGRDFGPRSPLASGGLAPRMAASEDRVR